MKNPLLVEMANSDGTYTYKSSKDLRSWSEPSKRNSQLPPEELEQTLDELNCSLNQAVTLNLTENKPLSGGQYCCSKHGKTVKIISYLVTVNGKIMKYYKHSIEDNNFQLAGIKYYKDNMYNTPRKRIRSGNLNLPIPGPLNVYVFHCRNNPALIFVKTNGTNKWYKRRNKNDYDSFWEDLSPKLKSITSADLDSLRCQQQRELAKLLNTLECTPPVCRDVPGAQPSISHVTVDLANYSQQQPLVGVSPKDQNINALDLGNFMGDLSGLLYNILKEGPKLIKTSEPITKELLTPTVNVIGNLSKEVFDVVLPPVVTIDVWNRTSYPERSDRDEPLVNVTKNFENPQEGFTEHIHTLKGHEDKHFTLQETKYNKTETDIPPIQRVTQVSVFYWTPLEDDPYWRDKNRPLLVKVSTQDPSGEKSTYYENVGKDGDLNWQPVTILSSDNLQKLGLLNCRLNNAVIIDVSKRSGTTPEDYDACDDSVKHDGDKVRVIKDGTSTTNLVNYQVYTHRLKIPYGKPFHVVGFKNNNMSFTELPKNILDVSSVKVYMCGSKDLLIYIDSKDPNISDKRWWKCDDGNTWKKVSSQDTPPYTKDYDKILGILDAINSNCAPPRVVIDISEKMNIGYYYDPGSSRRMIWIEQKLGKGTQDPPANYDLYIHTVESRPGSYFTLSGLVYGNTNRITVDNQEFPTGGNMENVTSVSVYYWKYPISGSRPLLMKIVQNTSKSKPTNSKTITWFENTSNGRDNKTWEKWENGSKNDLNTKLDLLNCRLNNAIVINVSERPNSEDTPTYYDEGLNLLQNLSD